MRKQNGVSGATLLYGPSDPLPDLVSIMQFLVDDLRVDGRGIVGVRLGPRSLRLRADRFDLALTLATAPLPPRSLRCVRRLSTTQPGVPDLARARMIRHLRDHRHAMGFIVRHRGLNPAPLEPFGQQITQLGRRLLLPVFEAAPPSLLIWQPGGLLFSASEFMSVEIDTLLAQPNLQTDMRIADQTRPQVHRPVTLIRPIRRAPGTRPERAAKSSAGRLFGKAESRHRTVLPRIEQDHDRVTTALRHPVPAPPSTNRHLREQRIAVAALWTLLLPQVFGGWLPI